MNTSKVNDYDGFCQKTTLKKGNFGKSFLRWYLCMIPKVESPCLHWEGLATIFHTQMKIIIHLIDQKAVKVS